MGVNATVKQILLAGLVILTMTACGTTDQAEQIPSPADGITAERMNNMQSTPEAYSVNARISDVMSNPAFCNYGRLPFPVSDRYYSGDTPGQLTATSNQTKPWKSQTA